MRPAISVICPIYNMEVSLRKCLNSISKQTFNDFEALLIDDGSTDHSGCICDEYAQTDPRFRVIHKQNAGVSAARQTGLDESRGTYTIHVDPDDWIEPDMLEKLYRKTVTDNADMVIADYYVNTGQSQRQENQRPTEPADNTSVLRDIFIGKLHGNCWNKLIKKSCYSIYGITFPSNLNFREDFCVMVQLLLHPIKIAYIDKAFYHYVRDINPNSIADTLSIKKKDDQLAVIGNVRTYLNGAYPDCLNILKADVACWLIETGFDSTSQVRRNFSDLMRIGTFAKLPLNRKMKIMTSFIFGRKISAGIHNCLSKIKTALKA